MVRPIISKLTNPLKRSAMGIFDLFKTKESKFVKQCLVDNPEYLKGNFQDVPDELFRKIKAHEKENVWVRQIVDSNGSTSFKVKYFGAKNLNLIQEKGDLPILLVAESIHTGEQVLLFDGCKHGYDAVFWQNLSVEPDDRKTLKTLEISGSSSFEVVVLVRYNLIIKQDFEKELQENGHVVNGKEELVGMEAFLNGFDSIDVFVVDDKGKKTEILSEETS